jgi:hypothetical protein
MGCSAIGRRRRRRRRRKKQILPQSIFLRFRIAGTLYP